MTWKELCSHIGSLATGLPNVRTFIAGTRAMMNTDSPVTYAAVLMVLDSMTESDGIQTWHVRIAYIDRLMDGLFDDVQIQSDGMEALHVLSVRIRQSEGPIFWVSGYTPTYTPFTEQLADLCAGAVMSIDICTENETC